MMAGGVTEGEAGGVTDGDTVGVTDGETVGVAVGEVEGVTDGDPEGVTDGDPEGVVDGEAGGVGSDGDSVTDGDGVVGDGLSVPLDDSTGCAPGTPAAEAATAVPTTPNRVNTPVARTTLARLLIRTLR